jgi:hypothetical protein
VLIGDTYGVSGYRASHENKRATSVLLNSPGALAIDMSGNLYVGDTENYRIRKINVLTTNITTVVGSGVKGFVGEWEQVSGSALCASVSFVCFISALFALIGVYAESSS